MRKFIPLIILLVALTTFFYRKQIDQYALNTNVSKSKAALAQETPYSKSVKIKSDITSDPYVVTVNPQVPLSYKTKEEIYNIRRRAVQNSIFDSTNYRPSNEVFGQIVSNKPWYSSNICKDRNTKLPKIAGPSEESRFINNPTMLVALEFPFLWSSTDNPEFCESRTNQLMPRSITYYKSKNQIVVKYSKLPFEANGNFFYQFNGVNAADLGYKYAYVDLKNSTLRPRFKNSSDNISNNIQEFRNFIHLGYSCQHEGGCNNGSPRQPALEFGYNENDGAGSIYIKLWKSRPYSPFEQPDITEIIVIQN